VNQLADIFLFVGTILVAFQIVGNIGYIATFLSMPFSLPLLPLMKKLGLSFKRSSRIKLKFQLDRPTQKSNIFIQIIWWVLLIVSVILFGAASAITLPLMMAYALIFRNLLGINKLMNYIYRKTVSHWDFMFLFAMQNNVDIMHYFNIKTTQKKYSDRALLNIRNKNEKDLPFVAFIGLLFIVAGFILQLLK
jgi:hypothetical protein